MKTTSRTITVVFIAFWMTLAFAAVGSAQEYKALEGIDEIKTIYDFRISDPASALDHLQLVHQTYNDPVIREISENPEFVVVFMDASVKLLSNDRNGYSAEEKEMLAQMDKLISTLANEGVRLEICEVAAEYFKVDLQAVSPEIERVKNGWISSQGYQLKDYALVPVF